ncbi:MAG: alpha/beta hydrolase [Methanomicrobiales archaeon]
MPVRQHRSFRIENDEILFLRGAISTVGVTKASQNIHLFIGMPEKDEVVQFLEKEDLIVVSAFDTGTKVEKGIKALIYLIKELNFPIVVLPDNHPTSKRLKMVVASGDHVNLDCNIVPGTHPEQDILCSGDDLAGTQIKSSENCVEIINNAANIKIEKLN